MGICLHTFARRRTWYSEHGTNPRGVTRETYVDGDEWTIFVGKEQSTLMDNNVLSLTPLLSGRMLLLIMRRFETLPVVYLVPDIDDFGVMIGCDLF